MTSLGRPLSHLMTDSELLVLTMLCLILMPFISHLSLHDILGEANWPQEEQLAKEDLETWSGWDRGWGLGEAGVGRLLSLPPSHLLLPSTTLPFPSRQISILPLFLSSLSLPSIPLPPQTSFPHLPSRDLLLLWGRGKEGRKEERE